ncbi:hypothetical protein PHLGIDRAFT_101279 [Phlebiopsis gigantea 11061_1 CR5-6]|uniref:Histone deacetylase complex subunit SAP18 n=1 Tax=Phlebiopsis gigantea (strain 11061_1 CR5-6) TaxID=745531 RepID=A0A0C3PSM3_PHLG1|nr:hypothetical protein PHLGIDRAFT_101279 [Phlebiopsis gigantea 11061_1 CR5-6]
MEDTAVSGRPVVDREKTAPFLIRTFIKVGTFHRLAQFEDGALPTAEEQQLFTWKDATLREVLTTLRSTAPASTEYRHPLARYSFRAIYADSANRGRIAQKDLGMVYSRDILGEPGTLAAPAPRLVVDAETADEERTLDELRFVPGDYMCVMVHLPKNVAVTPAELSIKGSGAAASTAAAGPGFANGWKKDGGRTDGGWSGSLGGGAGGAGRGGGHWRGESSAPAPVPRGARGSGRGRADAGDRDRRVPPPRRDSPPRRGGGWGDRDRERERGGRGRSVSRSRSPAGRRRNSRYD